MFENTNYGAVVIPQRFDVFIKTKYLFCVHDGKAIICDGCAKCVFPCCM